MKTNVLGIKIIDVGILAIAIMTITIFVFADKSLSKKLADEKLKSEILLSEKLSMEKLVNQYQADLRNLEGKNKMLDKMTADANIEVLAKNKEVEKLKANQQSARQLQSLIDDLNIEKQRLNNEIIALNKTVAETQKTNSQLSAQLKSAVATNSGLASDNSVLKAMISDNYRTEAFRGKREKLTVVAKKTDKLMVSFDMPEIYSNNVYFKVLTPEGNEYSINQNMMSDIKTEPNGDGLMASIVPNAGGPVGTQRVEMTYHPLRKLSKGIYQFNIYNEDRLLGSTQMRLK